MASRGLPDGGDRDAGRGGRAGDKALGDGGAVEVGPADQVTGAGVAAPVAPVDVVAVDGQAERAVRASDEPGPDTRPVQVSPADRPARAARTIVRTEDI